MPSANYDPRWQQLLEDAGGMDARALLAILQLREEGLSVDQLADALRVTPTDIVIALQEARHRRG